MSSEQNTIVLSLISHTNIGKTTLARTLLKKDIGVVRDAPHVTDESERHLMFETGGGRLLLWDTPGFGNVAKLLTRIRQRNGAWRWVLHEMVDRVFDRSLYCSVDAALNVGHEADVVLYLVSAQEHPEDAGYVARELELLDLLGKPTVMIISRAGCFDESPRQRGEALLSEWSNTFRHHDCLKDVLLLDGFVRTWLHELALMECVLPFLSEEKQRVLSQLKIGFAQRQDDILDSCSQWAAQTLWSAISRREPLDGEPEKIFERMALDFERELETYVEKLIFEFSVESEGTAALQGDFEKIAGWASGPLQEKKTGVFAGAMASAGSGLVADILAGGLTFGGGAVLGFLGGYLGGVSYAKLLNLVKKGRGLSWKKDTLAGFFKLLLSYYLLVAIHGRGRGKLALSEPVPFLTTAIDQHWPDYQTDIERLVCPKEHSALAPPADYLRAFSKNFRQLSNDILSTI